MIKRRDFLIKSAFSMVSSFLGKSLAASEKGSKAAETGANSLIPSYNILREVHKYRKIDAYANAQIENGPARVQLDYADRLAIERLILSVPIARQMGKTPAEITAYNDHVLTAVKRDPHRLAGQFTLSAAYRKESLHEMKRCLQAGMVGVKLYNQFKINDPLVYPIIEKCIENKLIIHVHGECQLGVGGYRMKYDVKNTPTISIPEDFAEIAARYPEALFQYAHIGGGGDWEYACKIFAEYPNIYVDTGGSNNSGNMVDFAVATLGEDRVLFGTDGSYYQSVGGVLSSSLTAHQKCKVFFENYNNLLKLSGRNFPD